MTQLTNQGIASTYGDVITCTNNGQGLTAVQTIIQDGLGNNSPILLATTSVNFNRGQGQFQLDGVAVTANSIDINSMCQPNPIARGTGALQVPVGTTAQRPGAPLVGDVRFNTSVVDLEFYIGGGTWQPVSSGGSVTSITGTAGQINVTNPNTTPVLSLDPNLTEIDSITSDAIANLTLNSSVNVYVNTTNGGGGLVINSGRSLVLNNFNNTNSVYISATALGGNATYNLPLLPASINDQALTSKTGGNMNWTSVQLMKPFNTVISTIMQMNARYVINAIFTVNLTLPTTANVGDVIEIVGSTVGWVVNQNAGQTIHFLAANTTTGVAGSLASTLATQCVKLVCSIANTDFIVSTNEGTLTVT